MDVTFRVVRDLFLPRIEEFLVDSPAAYEKCLEFAAKLVPQLASRGQQWDKDQPIFEATGIEREIEKALRRARLAQVGRLYRHRPHRALVAIDVNSGKYVASATSRRRYSDHLEAATRWCARSGCGTWAGIIIIDFITWSGAEPRDQVFKALHAPARR